MTPTPSPRTERKSMTREQLLIAMEEARPYVDFGSPRQYVKEVWKRLNIEAAPAPAPDSYEVAARLHRIAKWHECEHGPAFFVLIDDVETVLEAQAAPPDALREAAADLIYAMEQRAKVSQVLKHSTCDWSDAEHDAVARIRAALAAPRICPDCGDPIVDVAHWHEERPRAALITASHGRPHYYDCTVSGCTLDGHKPASPSVAVLDVEGWARAMHDSDTWSSEHSKWVDCNEEHRARYLALAERYAAEYDRTAEEEEE